jgi:hypothetical protein
MTELDPATAPTPAPLYVRGKRRPGPSSWGYDPGAPVLVPAERVVFKKPPPEYIGQASDFLGSESTFKNRRRELLDLRKRSRRIDGRRVVFTPGLGADEPESKLAEKRKPRGDHRARHHAALMALVEHAGPTRSNPRLDCVGRWSSYIDHKGEKQPRFEGFYSRHQLAAKIGVPVKELDVLIREWKDAGYIERRQRRRKEYDERGKVKAFKGDLASLLLTEKFYRSCGPEVVRARAKHLGLFRKPPAEPEGPTAAPAADKPVPYTTPEARGWGEPPPDDPPDPAQ